MTSWPVRVARSDDAAGIARVHVATWRHAYRDVLPAAYLANLSVDERSATWAAAIARDRPTVLVSEARDGIVGFSAVGPCRDTGSTAADHEIWAIYVAPEYWAAGVGRALWQASRALAVERGATRLSLWVFANNPRARRFYESVGMEREPASLQTFELGGIVLEELRYVVQLGPGAN
jgi:GNAT superfamily N-acetyltransferase